MKQFEVWSYHRNTIQVILRAQSCRYGVEPRLEWVSTRIVKSRTPNALFLLSIAKVYIATKNRTCCSKYRQRDIFGVILCRQSLMAYVCGNMAENR